MGRSCWNRLALALPFILGPSGLSGGSVGDLLSDLRSPHPVERERARGEILKLEEDSLPGLAAAFDDPDPIFRFRLYEAFETPARRFLDRWEGNLKMLASETAAFASIRLTIESLSAADEKALPAKTRQLDELRRRLASTEENLKGLAPKVSADRALARRVGPALYPLLAPVRPYRPAVVGREYARLLAEGVTRFLEEPEPEPDAFSRTRYLLSHVWKEVVEQGEGAGKERARLLLDRHLEATFIDLLQGPPEARDRGAMEFYLLGEPALSVLRERMPGLPSGERFSVSRLIELIHWRISPGLYRRTGLDLAGYDDLDWRERRKQVFRLERVGGQEAIPPLRRILDLEKSQWVQLAAAEALGRLGDPAGVELLRRLHLEDHLEIKAVSHEIYMIQGIHLRELERYAEAIAEFEKVIKEVPKDPRANYELGFTHLIAGRPHEAIPYFLRSLQGEPSNAITLYNLACAYSLAGRPEEALETLERAILKGFDDPEHMRNDPDLKGIRDHPRFKDLLEELRVKASEKEEG